MSLCAFQAVFHSTTQGLTTVESTNLRVFTEHMAVRGHPQNGENHNPAQRAELQGRPRFAGLRGPMFGGVTAGVPTIRYESSDAYKVLSA